MIIVDSKEILALRDEFVKIGVTPTVQALPNCVDIQIGKILIQRKEINDFYSSIFDKRVWEQAKGLCQYRKEDDCRPVFVIEGKQTDLHIPTREKGLAISRTKRTLIFSFGLPVFKTSSLEKTVKLLIKLDTKKHRPYSLHDKPKFKSLRQKQAYVVESFPDVGADMAKKLLAEYPTVYDIFQDLAGKVEPKKIHGLGPITRASCYDVLTKPIE